MDWTDDPPIQPASVTTTAGKKPWDMDWSERQPVPAVGGAESRPAPGLSGTIGRSADVFQRGLGATLKNIGELADMPDLAEYGGEVFEQNVAEIAANPRAIQSISDVESLGDFGIYALESLGEQAATMGASVAGGLIGGGIGLLTGPAAPVAVPALGALGAFAPSAAVGVGEIEAGLAEKGISDPKTALAAGGAIGALDVILPGRVVEGILARKVGEGIAGSVAKSAGRGALTEMPTETAQLAIEKAAVAHAADEPFDVGGFVEELPDTLAQAAIVGGSIGGVAGAIPSPAQEIDHAAIEAEPEPTEAQKSAGNYKKGHVKVSGLDISIENPRGSMRRGTDENGTPWEQEATAHYGYIRATTGKDGDQVDVFIGEDPESQQAFIVDQIDPETGQFDEHKVILGAADETSAKALYLSNYDDSGPDRLGAITPVSVGSMKQWLRQGDHKTRPFSETALAGGQGRQASTLRSPGQVRYEAVLRHEDGQSFWGIERIKRDGTRERLPNANFRRVETAKRIAGKLQNESKVITTEDKVAAQMESLTQRGDPKAAEALDAVLENPELTPDQKEIALAATEVFSQVVPVTGSGWRLRLVQELVPTPSVDRDAAARSGADPDQVFMAGATDHGQRLVEIALNHVEGNHNPLDTAAHEGFHVLQAMMREADPEMAKTLDQAFPDGKRITTLPASVRRTLKRMRDPLDPRKSVLDGLRDKFGDRPVSGAERQAIAFAAYDFARRSGQDLTMPGPMRQVLDAIRDFLERFGNRMRGGQARTAQEILSEASEGQLGRRLVPRQPEGRTIPPEATGALSGAAQEPILETVQPTLSTADDIPLTLQPEVTTPAVEVTSQTTEATTSPPQPTARAKVRRRPNASLLEFIAENGGIRDDDGELRAMDADTWHRQKPFRPRLVREDGRGADYVREAAEELGYLPEGATLTDFFEAIDREMRGTPVYPPEIQQQRDDAAERKAMAEEERDWLEREAAELGIQDVAGLSNDEIGAAILEAEAQIEPLRSVIDLAAWEDDVDRETRAALAEQSDPAQDAADRGPAEAPREAEDGGAPPVRPGPERGEEEPAADRQATGPESDPGVSEADRPEGGQPRAVDLTDQGEQTVIPGAERITDRELAERRMEGPATPSVPQQPADEGLFDTGARAQTDLQLSATPAVNRIKSKVNPAGAEAILTTARKLLSANKQYSATMARAGAPASLRPPADLSASPIWTAPDDRLRDHLTVANLRRVRSGQDFVEIARQASKAGAAEATRIKLQDRYLRLLNIQEEIEAAQERPLDDWMNAYERETLYHGKVADKLDRFDKQVLRPLMAEIKASGIAFADIEAYLYARHAPERNAAMAAINRDPETGRSTMPDGGSGMTNAEAAQIVAGYQQRGMIENLEAIAQRFYAINAMARDELEQSGVLSSEERQAWERYQRYVPLRNMDVDGDEIVPTGKGFDQRMAASKRALGRSSKAGDLMAHTLSNYETAVIRAEKNRVAGTFAALVASNPNPAVWSINKTTAQREIGPDGLVRVVERRDMVMNPNVLAVRSGGEVIYITIEDEKLARAMKKLGTENMGVVVAALSRLNRVLAALNTSLSPEFLVANFARDLQTALINLSAEDMPAIRAKVLKSVPSAILGIRSALRGDGQHPWAQHYQAFRKAGAQTGYVDFRTVAERRGELESRLRDIDPSKPRRALKAFRAAFELVEDYNTAVENGVRLSAFVAAQEAGLSRQKAAAMSKDLTVNFNRKGEVGSLMNALYLFYNASLQGNARMFRALGSKKVRRVLYGITAIGFAQEILAGLAGGDEEDSDYNKISDWEKEHNLIIPNPWHEPGGDPVAAKIPLPYGYSLFHSLGVKVGEIVRGRKDVGTAAAEMGALTVEAYSLIGSAGIWTATIAPTAIQPFVEISENVNFAGNPIMPTKMPWDTRPNSQLAWSTVSPQAKWTAETLNALTGGDKVTAGLVDVSPETLEHLFDFGVGSVGTLARRSVDTVERALDPNEEIITRDIPIVRRLLIGKNEFYERIRFREIDEQIRLAENRLKAYAEGGDRASVKRMREDFRPEIAMAQQRKKTEAALRKINQARRAIEASKLTDEEKDRKVKVLDEKADKIRRKFRQKYEELVRESQ